MFLMQFFLFVQLKFKVPDCPSVDEQCKLSVIRDLSGDKIDFEKGLEYVCSIAL